LYYFATEYPVPKRVILQITTNDGAIYAIWACFKDDIAMLGWHKIVLRTGLSTPALQ